MLLVKLLFEESIYKVEKNVKKIIISLEYVNYIKLNLHKIKKKN